MNPWYKQTLYFAWVIALISALGSLYYGEVLHLEPCRLCWYQRIAMFPLAFLLGVAFYKNDVKLSEYCLPLVGFGVLVSFYQVISTLIPGLQIHALCGEGTPCTLEGPLPYLSLLAFCSISACLLYHRRYLVE